MDKLSGIAFSGGKVYLLSLGCPRNLVDSEILLALLEKKGFVIVEDPEQADIAIVNTCGFIQSAKEESIEVVLGLAELKKNGVIKKLIVCGCLSQRYPSELTQEIKEIDAVFGTGDFTGIPFVIDSLFHGSVPYYEKITKSPSFLYDHTYKRKLLTPSHYAYIKIQEGCFNKCSYCIIPGLKGQCRSRTVISVIEEIKILKQEYDVKEFILTGQDTTSFGFDRKKEGELVCLLEEASKIAKESWIRLLYSHPAHFSDKIIDAVASLPNVCGYIDLPIQHANDKILRRMNRGVTKDSIKSLIEKLREKIKEVVIRTSVIAGFPGEGEDEFAELLDFLKMIKFERLGAFIYSREEGTKAGMFNGQVDEEIKRSRFDRIMTLQQKISAEHNRALQGRIIEVLVEGCGDSLRDQFIGRSRMDAPEVDGVVYFKGKNIKIGDFTDVRVTGSKEYDLEGEACEPA